MISSVSFIDIGILLIIGVSILVGILRGATREILGIAGWVGAFITVFYGLPLFRPLGRHYVHNPMLADALVGGILFILSLTIFIIVSRKISSGIKGSPLGGLDRTLGLVFGCVRGVFIVCLLYLTLGFFYPSSSSFPLPLQQASLIHWVDQGANFLKHLIPSDYLPHEKTSSQTEEHIEKFLDSKDLSNLEDTQ